MNVHCTCTAQGCCLRSFYGEPRIKFSIVGEVEEDREGRGGGGGDSWSEFWKFRGGAWGQPVPFC